MKKLLVKTKNELTGNVNGLTGDVDDCELTDADRKVGVDVSRLLAD